VLAIHPIQRDVGPQYYIQTINTSVGIYNKSDGSRVTAFVFNTLMSQGNFGNLCDTANFGDPVVLYDTFEDRWIITDFAFNLSGGNPIAPEYQCFAVSKTGDPLPVDELLLHTGNWWFWRLSEVWNLAGWPVHVGQYFGFGPVAHSECPRLGAQQVPNVFGKFHGPGAFIRCSIHRILACCRVMHGCRRERRCGQPELLCGGGAISQLGQRL